MIAANKLLTDVNLQEIARLVLVHIRKAQSYPQNRGGLSLLHKNIALMPTLISDMGLSLNHGRYTLPAQFFLLIYVIELKEAASQCHLAHQWFCGNLQISMIIIVFVIYCQLLQKYGKLLKINVYALWV